MITARARSRRERHFMQGRVTQVGRGGKVGRSEE
jgi:hypothetical protein